MTVPVELDDVPDTSQSSERTIDVTRYSFQQTSPGVTVAPALAERPVVSRPEQAFRIPPGETITLYISTPLWVQIRLPDTQTLLHELPSNRMSDTWFGVSTTQGELCYATRTSGRLELDKLPTRLDRALTPFNITNSAAESLLLERVELPARHLAVYRTDEHTHWTQTVRMTHTDDSDGARVHIQDGPPEQAADAKLVREPRDSEKRGLFTSTFKAFGALFGS